MLNYPQLPNDIIRNSRIRRKCAAGRKVLEFANESDTRLVCKLARDYFNAQFGTAVQAKISLEYVGERYASQGWHSPEVKVEFSDNRLWTGELVVDNHNCLFGIASHDDTRFILGEGKPVVAPLLRPLYRFWTEKGSEYRVFSLFPGPILTASRQKFGQDGPHTMMAQIFFIDEPSPSQTIIRVSHGKVPSVLLPAVGLYLLEYSRIHLEEEPLQLATWSDGVAILPEKVDKRMRFHMGHAITKVEVVPPLTTTTSP